MLTIKILPPSRYEELLQFKELNGILPPAQCSRVVVAEDENGHLKAMVSAMARSHVDNLLIKDEAQDGGFTGLKMLKLLSQELAQLGEVEFYSFVSNEKMVNYLLRAGFTPLPAVVFQASTQEVLNKK